jgi:hypothetical protein
MKGNNGSGNLIDAASISRSLASAPGVKSIAFRNINTSSIAGELSLSHVNSFLLVPGIKDGQFITYEQSGGGGRLAITLNRGNAPRITALLSPDLVDYLSCLMAPAALEDYHYLKSKTEYLSELKTFYRSVLKDKSIADGLVSDLNAARIKLTIDFPAPISGVHGGTFSGARAEFDIPLLDLLVLETALRYEVFW